LTRYAPISPASRADDPAMLKPKSRDFFWFSPHPRVIQLKGGYILKVLHAYGVNGIILHLEFQRRFGRVFVSSLPQLRYRSPERLAEVIAMSEAMGAAVSSPHTYVLDNAGWKRTDAPQPEFKTLADPHSRMNPGKLRNWNIIGSVA
jgi:hypothetical protein